MQPKVRALTEADIASGKYTLFDVVFPVPGYNTTFPEHACGRSLIDGLLREDGLTAPDVWLQKSYRDLSLGGTYRPILSRAFDVEWDVVTYRNPTVSNAVSGACGCWRVTERGFTGATDEDGSGRARACCRHGRCRPQC